MLTDHLQEPPEINIHNIGHLDISYNLDNTHNRQWKRIFQLGDGFLEFHIERSNKSNFTGIPNVIFKKKSLLSVTTVDE